MRSDIAKLLVERPRIGSGNGKKSRRARRRDEGRGDMESMPTKASMRRPYRNWYESKEFSENFSPFTRFLRKSVGRPWAKVYSEIREHLNLNSTVQYHVIQHLRQWVRTDVVMRDGKPFVADTYRYGPKEIDEKGRIVLEPLTRYRQSYDSFYVNPDTGILCQAPIRPQHKDPVLPEGYRDPKGRFQDVRVFNGRPYMKHADVWYAGDMVPLDRAFGEIRQKNVTAWRLNDGKREKVTSVVPDYGPHDFFFGDVGRVSPKSARTFYGIDNPKHYCRGRGHQLSTKELARLGLQNG